MHSSIRLNTPIEFINVTPINPLISKCQIKVCWVGDEPNRNHSIITKDVARQIANSLPGSPIVGYFNEQEQDFEEHNREFEIKEGKIEIKDTTRPYGFVDLNAKVWFARYLDDGTDEREYLMTEGWLWTGQYPECERILRDGNNHSMEFDKDYTTMIRTKGDNRTPHFFIVNEAIISKLCVLGQQYEPCFEGGHITAPTIQFSFSEGFEEKVFSMMNELKELLNEGGTNAMAEEVKVPATDEVVEDAAAPVVEPEAPVVEEPVATDEPVAAEEPATDFKAEDEEDKEEKVCPECGKPLDECKCDEDENKDEGAKKYNLEEIPEYVELLAKYSTLEQENSELKAQVEPLVAFKAQIEKKEKEDMIASFTMLSDEDKADVVANIDTYSLDDIEAKLSVICVRNKVSFASLEDDNKSETEPTTYNLDNQAEDLSVPAWVKAALRTQQNMK